MTPEQVALRDAFLSECWRPVPEYHQTDGERVAAWRRQQAVNGAGDECDESSQNVAAQVRKGHLTCDNGSRKTAPGPVVGATGRVRGLTPELARAPMNDALPAPCRQQVAH